MKKSKRFFAAMMAAAMTAGMLTGCGGGAKKESAAPAESAQGGSTEAAKEGEQVNLRFVSWQTANKELDKKVAEAYTKEHPNVTITYDYSRVLQKGRYDGNGRRGNGYPDGICIPGACSESSIRRISASGRVL